jgi:hypothetical protein
MACGPKDHYPGNCHLVRSTEASCPLVSVSIVVLQAVYAPALAILRVLDPKPLFAGDRAIGRRPLFHAIDMPLAVNEVVRFMARQFTGVDPLVDPRFLVLLPFIHPRRGLCGKGRCGHEGRAHYEDHDHFERAKHRYLLHENSRLPALHGGIGRILRAANEFSHPPGWRISNRIMVNVL